MFTKANQGGRNDIHKYIPLEVLNSDSEGCAIGRYICLEDLIPDDKTALMERIELLNSWPGANTKVADTTPSLLAYDDGKLVAWGSQVEDRHIDQYAEFKLLLHRPTDDDEEVEGLKWRLQTTGIQSSSLPPGKSAVQVTADFFQSIREYIWKRFVGIEGENYMKAQTISYVLTVPDGWSNHSKAEILRAALNAGFPLNVELVKESTALAVYCAIMSNLRRGSKFICKVHD